MARNCRELKFAFAFDQYCERMATKMVRMAPEFSVNFERQNMRYGDYDRIERQTARLERTKSRSCDMKSARKSVYRRHSLQNGSLIWRSRNYQPGFRSML